MKILISKLNKNILDIFFSSVHRVLNMEVSFNPMLFRLLLVFNKHTFSRVIYFYLSS